MKIIFKDQGATDFLSTVRKRVNQYFSENKLSKHANGLVHAKSVILLLLYIILYAGIMSDQLSAWLFVLFFMAFGIIKGLVGFNIVHDALHGAYSASPLINKILGTLFDLNGTSSYIWKVSHNGIHHTYTNIPGHDSDIDKAILLRLSPKDKIYPFHRFQNWYASFLYSLVSINWIYFSDYQWFFRELRKGTIPTSEVVIFFSFKALNFLLYLALPLALLHYPIWVILLGYLGMQVAGGFTISIIFQLAHVVENVHFPEADEKGIVFNNWGVHEMYTTSNFATQNKMLTFILGGLNCQIEHHLFPNICHVHYPQISLIVRKTAREFNLPYFENPTLLLALKSHYRKLKELGWKTDEVSISKPSPTN